LYVFQWFNGISASTLMTDGSYFPLKSAHVAGSFAGVDRTKPFVFGLKVTHRSIISVGCGGGPAPTYI